MCNKENLYCYQTKFNFFVGEIVQLLFFRTNKLILDVTGKYLNFMTDFDYNCGEGFVCNVTYDKSLAEEADAIIYSMEHLCLMFMENAAVSDTFSRAVLGLVSHNI